MKKIIIITLFLFSYSFLYSSWKQFQNDHKHTGTKCDVVISTPLCIKHKIYFGVDSISQNILPLVDDEGYFYVTHVLLGVNSKLTKIDPVTGQVIWKRLVPVGPTNAPGVIYKNKIIFPSTGKSFIAYDNNGNYLWNKTLSCDGWLQFQKPVTYAFDMYPTLFNDKIYTGTSAGEVIVVSAETGDTVKNFKVGSDQIIAAPAIDDAGTIYVGCRDNYFYAIDGEIGEIRWKKNLGAPIMTSASIDETGIYTANEFGEIFKLDKQSGEIIWTKPTGSIVRGTGALYGDHFFIGSDDRFVYKFDKYNGKVKWKIYIRDNIIEMSCIVICAKLFVLGCIDRLVMIDTETGFLEYICNTIKHSFSNIAYSDGNLYFVSGDNSVYIVGTCPASCKPCACDAKKLFTPTRTLTSTRTITSTRTPTKTINATSTITPTFTSTFTITSTLTYTQTVTTTPSETFTFTETITSTVSMTLTLTSTVTLTPTNTPTFTITQTPMPCDGVSTPVFNVKMIFNPENTDNIIFEIKSSVPLVPPPLVTIYPHGATCNKSILTFTAEEIPGLENMYRVLYPKQTGFGDIDKVVVKGKDICGVEGISDGSFVKSVISQLDVKIFNNVIKVLENERCTIHYKVYNNDKITIKIYTRTGNFVKTLFEGNVNPGEYDAYWDGRDEKGKLVSSGIYIVMITSSYYEVKDKISVLK